MVARASAARRPARHAVLGLSGLAAIAVCAGLSTTVAHADPITYTNTALAQPYLGTSPYGGFESEVGTDFDSTKLTVTSQPNSLDFQITTDFSGSDTIGATTVTTADIFLDTTGGAMPPAPSGYNYAISLGQQSANGGLPVGLYQVSSFKTSEQILAGSGLIYGGAYAASAATEADTQLAPTVVTGGTLVSGVAVSESLSGGVLNVLLTATDTSLLAPFNNFDLLFGTADCDNGPLFVDVSLPSQVPEPGTLAIFAAGLIGLCLVRRGMKGGGMAALA